MVIKLGVIITTCAHALPFTFPFLSPSPSLPLSAYMMSKGRGGWGGWRAVSAYFIKGRIFKLSNKMFTRNQEINFKKSSQCFSQKVTNFTSSSIMINFKKL